MGLFSFLKGQFIEVIEWLDDSGSMVYRFPVYDNAIKMGAKLIVRESQAAIFVNEGQIADVYGPGTYTLSTQNMPLLTALKSWPHAFNSPFKADVFFVSTANFTNLKWGTTNPVIMRDAEFGMVRLRGFGSYSIRVTDPAVFLRELFGTKSDFTTDQISGFLKSIIVTGISDLISESRIPVADLAASYEELSVSAAQRLQPHLQAMGLSLTLLRIENLSLPEEVERMIDRKSSMNIAGNLDQYMKYQTAEAIREAANNPDSGAAGTGAGLGAGMAMGQMMSQMMNRMAEPQAPAGDQRHAAGNGQASSGTGSSNSSSGPATGKKFCSECGERLAENAKFCSSCGTKV
ncbi:SPFH domain-containing protein [Paenibacillus spongiae]|uniref:SPFH domain-containing protein n=1 Tax=Paenibacillus spongiae TaxID=2909671 RepID=A0ABY5S4S6_9BACL|nr:SPFH domain-containing protein [Paenibacillus spongiae]UVI28901.1 SPFH domain-containing protein [Paenibacillus spongiae]